MRKLIGQHLIIGLSGKTLTSDEKKFIIENNIGGVILFSRNIESLEQVHALNTEIQALRHQMIDKAPLYISVDMEGGRVARLKAPFTTWPPLRKLGDLDSTSAAFKFSQMMGTELKAVGFNVDYAPCVDVYTNPKNEIIGDRSLGEDPELVAKIASALVRGYIKSEVEPCAKHFPGHGNTLLDSHEALPIEEKSLDELRTCEMIPFKKSFRARLNLVMMAHILYKKVDPEWPASLSEIWIKNILRDELKYRGLILSDDLDMKALTNHWDKETIAVQAMKATANILLYCNEPESPKIGLDAIEKALSDGVLPKNQIEAGHKMLLEHKRANLLHVDPPSLEEAKKMVGHPTHMRLSQAIASGDVPEELLA